jgi:uncharacterized damage-inducible protein DinB
MKEVLINLTRYNVWANKRIIQLLNEVQTDVLNELVPSSFPTIRKTIYHIWDAQVIWLQRMQGISLSVWPSNEYGDDFAGYDLYFIQQSEDFRNFVEQKPESFFTSVCFYKTINGKEYQSLNWEIIMHCMNHSTYHRGQMITMLHELGITNLPATDFIFYLRDKESN